MPHVFLDCFPQCVYVTRSVALGTNESHVEQSDMHVTLNYVFFDSPVVLDLGAFYLWH